jgi:hypothetical protein
MILQDWECFVESLGEKTFCARLIDKAQKEPDLIAEISYDSITENSQYCEIGRYFDLTISDDPEKVELIFREPRKFTQEEKEASEKEADELLEAFATIFQEKEQL